jgi:hypothetical protein
MDQPSTVARMFAMASVMLAAGCATAGLSQPAADASSSPAEAAGPGAPMPDEVRALLQSRCAGCHRAGPGDRGGWGSVLDAAGMIEAGIIVPGAPESSPLIGQLVAGEMPRRGPRLQSPEIRMLSRWIATLDAARSTPRPSLANEPWSKDRPAGTLAGRSPAAAP